MKIEKITAFILSVLLLCGVSLTACKEEKSEKIDKKPAVETAENDEKPIIESEELELNILNGTWRITRGQGLKTYSFDMEGKWASYTEENTIYQSGYIIAIQEYEDLLRYDLYTDDNNLAESFYLDGQTRFYIANSAETTTYEKITR